MSNRHKQNGLTQRVAALEAQVTDLRCALSGAVEVLSAFAFLPPEFPEGWSSSAPDGPMRRIVGNLEVLRALEVTAARRLQLGDLNAVLNLARAAGDWASTHHPGLYMSHEFERILRQTGEQLAPPWTSASVRKHTTTPRHVFHVLTAAAQIGGHTRLAGRWAQWDESSRHEIIVTEHLEHPAPSVLGPTPVRVLKSERPADRIAELIIHMREAELVVLHIHPYDAVAVAACGAPNRPPTVLLDHGDHIFWLGVGAADLVVSLRPSGQVIARTRRGVPATRNPLLPVPIPAPQPPLPRPSAKAALGLSDSIPILLTMASPMKYESAVSPNFVDLIRTLLAQYSQPHLIAVGPTADRPSWKALSEDFGDRVHLAGPLADPSRMLAAADIYLDSFPFGSLTSLLEAASYDIPAVVLSLPGAGPMALDDPTATFAPVESGAKWLARLGLLLQDADFRLQEGIRFGDAVRSAHSLGPWRRYLQDIYRTAAAATQPPLPSPQLVQTAAEDLYLESFQTAAQLGRPGGALLTSYGLLPPF